MCGIAGIVQLNNRPVDKWRLEKMNQAMRHRGPDGEGFWLDGSVGLGHTRLAIIDLSTGDQPIQSEAGTVAIFNGEIYNFRDLRSELQKRGHIFRTTSDTEVLLYAYDEWGKEMLRRLNGMFAFAILDPRRRQLFLARDRLGVKPLYYFHDAEKFVFASELGGLTASGLVPHAIDSIALDLYLHYQYIPSPVSIYKDVKKLSPAEYGLLKLDTGDFQTRTYWNISPLATDRSKSFKERLEELHALLDDAVRIRLISDVPFGAFLSGGTDSGLVVAMMAKHLNEPVKTFSIGLADEPKDELKYARMVAEKFETRHQEFRVTPEGLKLIPKLCPHFGEPFADSSAVPTYYVSKIARQNVKMALTGDGGDEMFGGYNRYAYLMNALAPSAHNVAMQLRSSLTSREGRGRLARVVRWIARNRGEVLETGVNLFARRNGHRQKWSKWSNLYDATLRHFNLEERRALLGRGVPLSDAHYFKWQFAVEGTDNIVALAQYSDLKTYLPGDILVKLDRMSMANSLEVRSPLLDYRIAEFAFALPAEAKIAEPRLDGSTGKLILKELASQYLGRDYVFRPKEGFGIPVSRWLKEDKFAYLHQSLMDSSPVYDYLDKKVIQEFVAAHLNGSADHGYKLWNLLMLDGWLRHVHAKNA